MSLVKTTALKNGNHGANGSARFVPTPGTLGAMNDGPRDADGIRRRAKTLARQQQAAERLASASAELSHGVQQASTATQEMRAAMTQIAEGAETNARAAQETLAASSQIAQAFLRQSELAASSLQTTTSLAANLVDLSSGIGRMVTNVSAASQRQSGSVEMIRQLEQRANDIGEIVKAVARIADQTNLLALNAAIEAARAGGVRHGLRGRRRRGAHARRDLGEERPRHRGAGAGDPDRRGPHRAGHLRGGRGGPGRGGEVHRGDHPARRHSRGHDRDLRRRPADFRRREGGRRRRAGGAVGGPSPSPPRGRSRPRRARRPTR
jgi:hypothetical protein